MEPNLILVVEDHESVRNALKILLEAAGYRVACAANGQEALDYLRTGPHPCLILLDLQTPVLDGWAFRREQLQDPDLASIPVTVLSAMADVSGKEDLLGNVGYLQKPMDPDELLAAVERFTTSPRPEVLLVENDPVVQKLLEATLRHYGFDVLLAADRSRAVELYREHRKSTRVVLLDVYADSQSWLETLLALRTLNPDVHFCFISRRIAEGEAPAFPMPFQNRDQMVKTIWKMIRKTPPRREFAST